MTSTAYLVSHTHWDREWYRTFQQFRLDLVTTIDGILDVLALDSTFTHFLLDGQTIVLDDYLEMRPHRCNELHAAIASGRLGVGPWYCHPDLFLVSGEAIIRNLILGIRSAREAGKCMMIGYVPDQFGHTGQLPQIFRQLGIGQAVLWRGVDTHGVRNEAEWVAPDGSSVDLFVLAQSYGNANTLPLEPHALADRLQQLASILQATASGDAVLLMNGHDHLPIQGGLPLALEQARQFLPVDFEIVQSSLQEALNHLRGASARATVLTGELRSSATAHLLPGVLSARIPLKQRNAVSQSLLQNEAEPYAAWASLTGAPYPQGELQCAWKLLLQNHPHDSICGCSIDSVHHEMVTRFNSVDQIANELIGRSLDSIIHSIDTRLLGNKDRHVVPFVVFNPAPGARRDLVTVAVEIPGVTSGYALIDDKGVEHSHTWEGTGGEPSTVMQVPRESIPSAAVLMSQIDDNRVMGMGLQSIKASSSDSDFAVDITVGDQGIMQRAEIEADVWEIERQLLESAPRPVTLRIHRNAPHTLSFEPPTIPGYGYRTFWLVPRNPETLGHVQQSEEPAQVTSPGINYIRNDFVEVSADVRTGSVTIKDLKQGTEFGPCNIFTDEGDCGDTYTYCPPETDTIVTTPLTPQLEVTLTPAGLRLTITSQYNIPAHLQDDRRSRAGDVPLTIVSSITLSAHSPRVNFDISVVNAAKDHRLRVGCTVPVRTQHAYVESAFDIVERQIVPLVETETDMETPVSSAPQQGFVYLRDEHKGLLVTNHGLPEYSAETTDDGNTMVWLTLLRCVGWLSRDDLKTRKGSAGPSLIVEDAQCLGNHEFHYSLIPFGTDVADAITDASAAHVLLRSKVAVIRDGSRPPSGSFLHCDSPWLKITAIKRADNGSGTIIRGFNADTIEHTVTLTLAMPVTLVELVSLEETYIEQVYSGSPTREFTVTVPAKKLLTLRLIA